MTEPKPADREGLVPHRRPLLYCKRPVVVEAQQWTGDNIRQLWEWVTAAYLYGPIPAQPAFLKDGDWDATPARPTQPARLYVAANDAWLDLEVGEWIIRDSLGFYPCKPSIFAETYEPVDPS